MNKHILAFTLGLVLFGLIVGVIIGVTLLQIQYGPIVEFIIGGIILTPLIVALIYLSGSIVLDILDCTTKGLK